MSKCKSPSQLTVGLYSTKFEKPLTVILTKNEISVFSSMLKNIFSISLFGQIKHLWITKAIQLTKFTDGHRQL